MTSIPNNFSDSGRKLYQSVRVLTAREKQIALLLIQGESNSFIANTLNLANTTVSTHKARIFQKSGVSNIIDLREKFLETDVLDRSIY
jgi:DNA-binding NarL/FixJ family response regulator